MDAFSVTADKKEREVTREVHPNNVLHDVVEYSRSKQVLNEEQTLVTLLIYVTGWLSDWHDYAGGKITGGSSGGKSHMKQNVIDPLFDYIDDALYAPTGFSAKAIQDDPEWDRSKVAALNELQKIPDEVLEFLKSAHGDDGGFDYRRNVADPDSDSGFTAKSLKSEPKPVIFMLADENKMQVEQELQTRLIEVKVDETEEKNEAVHRMKWGHDHITLPSVDQEYVWEDNELDHTLRKHIQNLPEDLDVLIPTGDGNFEGDDWDAASVVGPMFAFKRSESTRASSMLASLVKASAIMNYHAREHVEMDGQEYLVAEPVDVANIFACRPTLLALTHGLTEKKFAVLDAIRDVGGRASAGGTAVQATKKSIIQAIQDNPNIASMSKSEVGDLLDELDESLVINKKENPEDRREHLYVYDGSATFDAPAIYEHYDKFADVVDPIRDQPIERTIHEQLEELNAKVDSNALAEAPKTTDSSDVITEGSERGLEAYGGGGSAMGPELTEAAETVAESVSEVLDDKWVPARVMESNALKVQHMVGATPVESYTGENADGDEVDMVEPSRAPNGGDYVDSIYSPDNPLWENTDVSSHNEAERAIEKAIEELREKGVLSIEKDDVGNAHVTLK